MVKFVGEEQNQGVDEECDKCQVIGDVWEDLLVVHKLQ